MDKEVVDHMDETMQSAERLANRANFPHMEEKRRCARPREIQRKGFRNGRRTTDGMFSQRQLVEKRLEWKRNMALVFGDLEKNL